MPKLLLIDDEPDFSSRLARGLQSDYKVTCLEQADSSVLERLAAGEFSLVLLDNHLPKMSGLEFLQKLEQRVVTVPVILVTGDGDFKTVRDAMDRGAFEYVQKRPTEELVKELKPLIARALESHSQAPPVVVPGISTSEVPTGPQLIGTCRAMTGVYGQIARVAKIAQPVLIMGESGTGKDLVARAIHDNGPRRERPFVVVRCNTFDDDSLRDELFGHEIGFRGEGKLRKGKIENASGGSLYLDEIGELPRALQDDVLRIVEEQRVTRLGDNEPILVDVRVLAASRRDLHAVPESKFRRELLVQLSSETIRLPPLCDRLDDLKSLAEHFLQKEAERAGKRRIPALDTECWTRLRAHSWPGNIRELQTVLRKAVVRCRGPRILARDLSFDEPNAEPQIVAGLRLAISNALSSGQSHLYPLLLDMLRKELVELTLRECKGDAREASARLGVSLDRILNPDDGRPNSDSDTSADPFIDRKTDLRMKAMAICFTHPEWTVKRIAKEIGCSIATLYRDDITKRAIIFRGGDRGSVVRGHKSRDGTIEAYSKRDNK